MKLSGLKKLSLLYIEDDEEISKNYINSFKLFFKNIFIAKNYDEAIIIYKRKVADIILVDIELKNSLNGIAIVESIRKDNLTIPIVFLTSHNDSKHILEAVNLQIDGYIIKPLDISSFQ